MYYSIIIVENDVQLVGLIQSIITPDNLGSEADGDTEATTTASAVSHFISIQYAANAHDT